ncbi:hypothetical protein AN958_03477, partial [Leucoagaricus sp. SymC.cos]
CPGLKVSEEPIVSETGEEVSEYSSVWHIYNEEAHKADTSLVEGSHREIDVLLVFTGLFSAVLTTFIIQVYQMTLPDPADETNELLKNLTRQLMNLGTQDQPDKAPEYPTPAQKQCVNGLWFAALACSLSTALVCMLAKQWLYAYTRGIPGSPQDRARKRQNRFIQFRSWHVMTVMNCLPLLLHAALFLFFGGIVVLLWKGELAISVATVVIVSLAYIFYTGSMWISLISPDCPYQHPISTHLHHWLKPSGDWYKFRARTSATKGDIESWGLIEHSREKESSLPVDYISIDDISPTSDDMLDATALIWLFKESSSPETARSSALQAIAGLSRDFTAYELLRRAEAIEMILERFEACFRLDTSVGTRWYIRDPYGAEKYCRGWMRLTYQTKAKWPLRLLQPLEMLRTDSRPAISATAVCALALSSPERYGPQNDLFSLLSRHVDGHIRLPWSAQQFVLDTLLECIVNWELSAPVIADLVSRGVPILVSLLHLLGGSGPYTLREAITLNLYALTGHFVEGDFRKEGTRRKYMYWEVSIEALSDVVQKRGCYAVEGDRLLELVAVELARLANVLVTNPQRFSDDIHQSMKATLTTLFLENRLTTNISEISKDTYADILYLLHPPTLHNTEQQILFTSHLIETLNHNTDHNILYNTLRLLDAHLSSDSASAMVMEAFMERDGLNALLHLANTGNIDSRKLQMDSLRALSTFIKTSATLQLEDSDFPPSFFDAIFQSSFLKTLCSLITTGRWWIPDVGEVWLPALVKLCMVRPDDPNWRTVEQTFRKYANMREGEYRQSDLTDNLYRIRELRRHLEGGRGVSFFEDDF